MGRARHVHGIRKAHAIVTGAAAPERAGLWVSPEQAPGFARDKGAEGPLEIEVGHGNGAYLLARARAEPAACFLGVEKDGHYFQQLLRQAGEAGFANLCACWADGVELVQALPPGCADAVHFYFPDPWPKKRHHRRRFFQAEAVAAVWRALKPGGALWTATDDPAYFADIAALLAAGFEAERFPDAWPDGLPRTRYEVKWTEQKHQIQRARFRRRDAAAPETWPRVRTSADDGIEKQRKRMLRRGAR